MHFKLGQLQAVVKNVIAEEKTISSLRSDISTMLGPTVIVEGDIIDVIDNANDILREHELRGSLQSLQRPKTAVLLKLSEHKNPEFRKFAARLLPEKLVIRLAKDRDPSVRIAVAARVPYAVLQEMVKNFSSDDGLRTLYLKRRLNEGGVSDPKKVDPFISVNKKKLGDAGKTDSYQDLSDQWYEDRARDFIKFYGNNLEGSWEETAAHRFCSSMRATNGVIVDELKLLKKIKDLIEDHDDFLMKKDVMKESREALLASSLFEESFVEEVDQVRDLLVNKQSHDSYLIKASKVLNVEFQQMKLEVTTKAVDRFNLVECTSLVVNVPTRCKLPHAEGFRSIDERALDLFCESWNSKQRMRGITAKVSWTYSADDDADVDFIVSE